MWSSKIDELLCELLDIRAPRYELLKSKAYRYEFIRLKLIWWIMVGSSWDWAYMLIYD